MLDLPSKVKEALDEIVGHTVAERATQTLLLLATCAFFSTVIVDFVKPAYRWSLCGLGALLALSLALRSQRDSKHILSADASPAKVPTRATTRSAWAFITIVLVAALLCDLVLYSVQSIADIGPSEVVIVSSDALVEPTLAARINAPNTAYCLKEDEVAPAAGPDFCVALRPTKAIGEVIIHDCFIQLFSYEPLGSLAYRTGLGAYGMNEVAIDVPVGIEAGSIYKPQGVRRGDGNASNMFPWRRDDTIIDAERWARVRVIPRFQKTGVYRLAVSLILTANMRSKTRIEWPVTTIYVMDVELLDESFGVRRTGTEYDETETTLSHISAPTRAQSYRIVRERHPAKTPTDNSPAGPNENPVKKAMDLRPDRPDTE